jgi:UDPglucose--hexose-1-phosphate uridylyltransferase
MALISFARSDEKAGFFSPLTSMKFAEQIVQVRRDPLTGMTAVSSGELATKEEMFYGKTDWPYAEALAQSSRDSCFFCPERVLEATPKYADAVVPGGRLQRARALVFPNLFPLAALHAVVTYPDHHFLRLSEFSADLVAEGLGAAVDFAGRAERALAGLEHLELCCNHMLPAGASLAHPHYQVFGGPSTPWFVSLTWERAAAFAREHGVSYWQTLVDEEAERGERFIAEQSGCTWLAAYAPTGGREIVAVLPGFARIAALGDEQVAALAGGLAKILAWYEREDLSAFNFTLGGGPLSGNPDEHAVTLRVIARSSFRPDYRTDDYFLQKQLGGELVFAPPEEIAKTLREEFAIG